jgi:hypothetical protein
MADPEHEDPEGTEPFEEAGPAGSSGTIDQCSVGPEDLSAPPEDLQVPFFQEMVDAHVPETIVMIVSPIDGLPVPGNESDKAADAPSLSIEKMVCVEDDRQYVELFVEEMPGKVHAFRKRLFEAFPDSRMVLGDRSKWDKQGQLRARLSFDPSRVLSFFGLSLVELDAPEQAQAGFSAPGRPVLLVRPARERCRFYKRQVFGDGDFTKMYRNCTERRTLGGAFLSLDDQSVLACEYRSPSDPETTERVIDLRDRTLMRRMADADREKKAFAESGGETEFDVPDVAPAPPPDFFGGDFGVL